MKSVQIRFTCHIQDSVCALRLWFQKWTQILTLNKFSRFVEFRSKCECRFCIRHWEPKRTSVCKQLQRKLWKGREGGSTPPKKEESGHPRAKGWGTATQKELDSVAALSFFLAAEKHYQVDRQTAAPLPKREDGKAVPLTTRRGESNPSQKELLVFENMFLKMEMSWHIFVLCSQCHIHTS